MTPPTTSSTNAELPSRSRPAEPSDEKPPPPTGRAWLGVEGIAMPLPFVPGPALPVGATIIVVAQPDGATTTGMVA